MRKIFFYILFVLVTYNVAISQTYNFTNYNVSDGIEQSDILSVSQSINGYLLYGSNGGGLGVYDGYAFKSIKEKHGLSNNIVFSIDVSHDGEIWTATKEGVSLINKNVTNVLGSYAKGVSFYSVHVNNSTNEVWFGSGQGLFKYNNKLDSIEFIKTKNDVLNTCFINTIFSDFAGYLWIGTKNACVFLLQKNGE